MDESKKKKTEIESLKSYCGESDYWVPCVGAKLSIRIKTKTLIGTITDTRQRRVGKKRSYQIQVTFQNGNVEWFDLDGLKYEVLRRERGVCESTKEMDDEEEEEEEEDESKMRLSKKSDCESEKVDSSEEEKVDSESNPSVVPVSSEKGEHDESTKEMELADTKIWIADSKGESFTPARVTDSRIVRKGLTEHRIEYENGRRAEWLNLERLKTAVLGIISEDEKELRKPRNRKLVALYVMFEREARECQLFLSLSLSLKSYLTQQKSS